MTRWISFALLSLTLPGLASAQGDGPRSFQHKPIGLNILTPMYLNIDSNFNFQQTILVKDADVVSDVGVLTYVRTFAVAGHTGEFRTTGIWGSVSGTVNLPDETFGGTKVDIPRQSGIADPIFTYVQGLVGTPALTLEDFTGIPPRFQASVLFAAAPPLGQYDSDRLFNLGTNRWTLRLGVPLVLPFGSPASRTSLEITPSIYYFTDNTEPSGPANLREQDPRLVVESYLSRNFTPRLWGNVGLLGTWGGETITDGVPDDNRVSQLAAGGGLGYQITRSLSVLGVFGGVIHENDDSRGTMIRIQASWTF